MNRKLFQSRIRKSLSAVFIALIVVISGCGGNSSPVSPHLPVLTTNTNPDLFLPDTAAFHLEPGSAIQSSTSELFQAGNGNDFFGWPVYPGTGSPDTPSFGFSGWSTGIQDYIDGLFDGASLKLSEYSYFCENPTSTPLALYPAELACYIPVPCNCHMELATTGTHIGTGGNHIREFLFRGQQLRIRQNGAIRKISLYVAELTGIDRFYITFWRFNGSTYDRVGQTDNIIAELTEDEINDVVLGNPIQGIRTGDYYGIKLVQPGNDTINPLIQCPVYNARVFWFNSDPGDTNVDFLHGSDGFSSNGGGVPVICFMTSPVILTIGDSLTSGHPFNFSFVETTHRTNLSASYPWLLGLSLNLTVQNMGTGANSIGQIEARFIDDCIQLHPRIAVIEGGVKDLMLGTSTDQYLASWKSILELCSKNGVMAIVIGILPWTTGTNSRMLRRDALNEAVQDMVKGYAGFAYIDPDTFIGKFRPSGPPGNLWDIRDEFDSDGLHLTEKGYGQLASMVRFNIAYIYY